MVDSLPPIPQEDVAAVFGRHAVSACQRVEYSKAEPLLRPNLYDFNFSMGMSWFLLMAFAAFVFMAHYKRIEAVAFYLFNFKKYLKIPMTQQRLSTFVFAAFALLSLAMLAANLWRFYLPTAAIAAAFAWSLLALSLYFTAKYLLCFLIQAITQQRMLSFNLLLAEVNVFFALCFLLIPLFMVQTLLPADFGGYVVQVQAAIGGIFLMLYLLKTLTIFIADKISPFFWLLYFTAIELFPMAVIYKLIVKN